MPCRPRQTDIVTDQVAAGGRRYQTPQRGRGGTAQRLHHGLPPVENRDGKWPAVNYYNVCTIDLIRHKRGTDATLYYLLFPGP